MKWKLLKRDIKNVILGIIIIILFFGGWILFAYLLGILYLPIMKLTLAIPYFDYEFFSFVMGMLTAPFYFLSGLSLYNRYSGKERSE